MSVTKSKKSLACVSLERAISKLGLASRTQARKLILDGKVKLHQKITKNPNLRVDPDKIKIEIDGQTQKQIEPITIALHKPKGLVTTRSDEKNRPTVYDCIPDISQHISPIGRLDLHTSGLLLMTNDTHFAAWITDPKNDIKRVYLVTVRGEVLSATVQSLLNGIIDDGEKLKPLNIEIRKSSQKETHLLITLNEGKNREIRRMFLHFDHEVTALKRVSFGGIELQTLPIRKWRKISTEELKSAFPGAPIKTKSI